MNPPDHRIDSSDDIRPNPANQRDPDHDVEIELISMLQSHGPREGEALASYQRLIEDSDDEGLRYLVQLILEDERRHHKVIEEMLHVIQGFVWEVDVQPSVPGLSRRVDPELRAETQRLLALEQEDAKELRRLRTALRHSHNSPMLPLLAELMVHDTAKHIAILKFIRSHTRSR